MYIWEVIEAVDAAAMSALITNLYSQNYTVNQIVVKTDGSYALLTSHYEPPES